MAVFAWAIGIETRAFFLLFVHILNSEIRSLQKIWGAGGNNMYQEYGQSTKFYTRRLRPEVQPIGLYTIFD